MCICNDRRWPETYRVMGMQGVELVLLGYNTPTHLPWVPVYDHLADFHNHLCMQAGAYQNSTWVVGIAKAGNEEGSELLAGSCIVAPSGEIVAQATTKGDEVFTARCDLDHQPVQQGGDVQLRPAPPHRALRADHPAGRRHPAAGLMPPRLPRVLASPPFAGSDS